MSGACVKSSAACRRSAPAHRETSSRAAAAPAICNGRGVFGLLNDDASYAGAQPGQTPRPHSTNGYKPYAWILWS